MAGAQGILEWQSHVWKLSDNQVDGTGNPYTWKAPESKMVGGGGKYVALSSNSRK